MSQPPQLIGLIRVGLIGLVLLIGLLRVGLLVQNLWLYTARADRLRDGRGCKQEERTPPVGTIIGAS